MIETSMPGGIENQDGHLNLGKDLDELMSSTSSCTKEVARLTRDLPEVDAEGHSKVPDAEQRYAQKARAARRLEWKVILLETSAGTLSRKIEQRHKGLNILEQDRARLHNMALDGEYGLAIDRAKDEIERLTALRASVKNLVREAREVLRDAAQETWPLGEPREQVGNVGPFEGPHPGGEPFPRPASPRERGPMFPGRNPGRASS